MNIENLSTLQIHKLTREQYKRELEAGRIDEKALYLTPDEETDLDAMELITNDDIDAICGGNVGIGSGSVGSSVSAEPDLVITALEENYSIPFDIEAMSINWEDVVATIDKCINHKNIKVVVNGTYRVNSGSPLLPIYVEPFSVFVEDSKLKISMFIPDYYERPHAWIYRMELDPNNQRIDCYDYSHS